MSLSPVPVGLVASQFIKVLAALVRTMLQLPCPSPASGASQALPLLLRWLRSRMKRAPVAFCCHACASDGRLRGPESPPFTNATLFRAAVWPTGVTLAGL